MLPKSKDLATDRGGKMFDTAADPSTPRPKPCRAPLRMTSELEVQFSRRAPLGNHQFAAALFFQLHGFVQGGDGGFDLVVRREAAW